MRKKTPPLRAAAKPKSRPRPIAKVDDAITTLRIETLEKRVTGLERHLARLAHAVADQLGIANLVAEASAPKPN